MSEEQVQEDLGPAEADTGAADAASGAEGRDEGGVEGGGRLVPVTESIRYRRRAQAAESRLKEVEEKFTAAQKELEDARRQIGRIERRQRIDELLLESDAIDLEAARLLTEAAVAQMEEEDVTAAVEELKRRKPYLFRRAGGVGGSMAARTRPAGRDMNEAAETAALSGDRRDLLRYLRMRRRCGAE